MSARLGCRKPSPSSDTACTASATSVGSDRDSCTTRRAPRRAAPKRPLISSPPAAAPLAQADLDGGAAGDPEGVLVDHGRYVRIALGTSSLVVVDWVTVPEESE